MLPAVMRRPARLIEQLTRPLPPLLAALFEDSGTGALVLDRERRIVRTNRRLDAMLAGGGVAPHGVPAEALFAPADRPRVAAALAAALGGDPPPPLQVRLQPRTRPPRRWWRYRWRRCAKAAARSPDCCCG